MKKLLPCLIFFCFITSLRGQTVLFFEDFETLPLTQITSTGSPGWGVSTHLASGGLRSDSANCLNPGDSSVLTTIPFSAAGLSYVILEFDHICKVEFYDAAFIEVSSNGGATWHRLTGAQYLGQGQFVTLGNRFNSASYLDWLPGNPTPRQYLVETGAVRYLRLCRQRHLCDGAFRSAGHKHGHRFRQPRLVSRQHQGDGCSFGAHPSDHLAGTARLAGVCV
jgi:hypothetical protein